MMEKYDLMKIDLKNEINWMEIRMKISNFNFFFSVHLFERSEQWSVDWFEIDNDQFSLKNDQKIE